MTKVVDINADCGESFGRWTLGNDEALFDYLTSANLACGFHAGDPLTMQQSVKLAKNKNVAIGAHPGFPDMAGFGRRIMAASPDEVYSDVLYQIAALKGFLAVEGIPLHHVKPHGALHHKAVADKDTSLAIAHAVKDAGNDVPLVALGAEGGRLQIEAANEVGVKLVLEAFPERAYIASGKLAPRSMEGSSIHDPQEAAERALQMVVDGKIPAIDGGEVEIQAETLCIHGDNPHAVTIAKTIQGRLEQEGIAIKAF